MNKSLDGCDSNVMYTLKRSRRGTQLNDPYYFRQPPPHPREHMRLLNVISDESNKTSSKAKANLKKSDRCSQKIDLHQRSEEIAVISYDDYAPKQNSFSNDTTNYSGTIERELTDQEKKASEQEEEKELYLDGENVIRIVENFLEVEENNLELEENAKVEEICHKMGETAINKEEIDQESKYNTRKQLYVANKHLKQRERIILRVKDPHAHEHMRNNEVIKEEKTWWRTIVDFFSFGFFLGRKETNDDRQNNENVREFKTDALVSAKPGYANIYSAYKTFDKVEENDESSELDYQRTKRTHNNRKKYQHFDHDRLKMRKISSPIF